MSYICNLCNVDFKTQTHLKRHQNNVKPCFEKIGLDCPYCYKTFINQNIDN